MIVKIDVDGVIRDVMSAICALNARDFGEVVSPTDIVRYDFSGLFHKVREQFGVELEPEIQLLGRFEQA